jgi:hypothetical protein
VLPEDVRFESLKEDRDWYFVEYSPPLARYRFSIVQLSCVEPKDVATVAEAMETEARAWLKRYPIPVMVTAFSPAGDVISLGGVRPNDNLMAWDQYPTAEPTLQWRLVPNDELPDIALDRDFVESLFASVPHKTRREIEEDARQHERVTRVGWWLVFVWAVVVPLVVAILEWWSDLLGVAVLLYAFYKAGKLALRLSGRLPKSDSERKREAEDLQMRHHHYHCKRNPEAFARLKAENFRQWEVERTLAQSNALKTKREDNNVDG